jgi:acetyl-CoA acetyltransferase
MKNAYIIDAIRTPFGRYAGGLATVRAMIWVQFRFKP